MSSHYVRMILASTFLVPTGAFAQTAASADEVAQSQPSEGIADIVVTAQKRSESVQKTPLAVTAIGGDALRASGTVNVDGITASVPTLQIGQTYGSANIALRGISLNAVNFGAENPVAFHLDGVFVARPAAVLGSFFDMQRVEVLRGAQGTLYGRNATGGSINLITADPTNELSGYAQLTYGNYDHLSVEAAIGGPIIDDKLMVRLSVRSDDREGWGKNEFTGNDIDDNKERAIRGKILFKASEDLSFLLSADYAKADDHMSPHYGGTPLNTIPWGVQIPSGFPPFTPIDLGGQLPSKVDNISSEVDPVRRNRFWGTSLTVDWNFSDFNLKSISAYRGSNTAAIGDLDQTSFPLGRVFLGDKSRQFSQEFALSYQGDRSKGILGVYYFHEKDDGHNSVGFNSILLNPLGFAAVPAPGMFAQGYYSGSKLKTDAYAIFGQFTYEVIDRLSLTVGGRYSIERKEALNQGAFDLVNPFDQEIFETRPDPSTINLQCGEDVPTIGYGTAVCVPHKTFKAFTPKVGLEFQMTPQTLFYASVSKGFKSGVYSLGTNRPPVNPEKLWDYEAGVKSTMLDGRLRVNLSGFYYDYKDLQVNKVVNTDVVLENAASAKIYGLEAEIQARPVSSLQLDANASYLHATFSRFISADNARPAGDGTTIDEYGNPAFNLKDNRLPQSPKFSGRIGASYTGDIDQGSLTLRGEAVYTGKIYWTPYNLDTTSTPDRTRFNASLRFEPFDGRWNATLNVKNLTNKRLITNGFVATSLVGLVVNGYNEAPRTIDFTVGYNF